MLIQILSISLVVIIIITVIKVLLILNKGTKERIIIEKGKISRFKNEFKKIKPDISNLKEINKFTRSYFKEAYNMELSLTYLELAQRFDKQKKKKHADFCRMFSEINYSGKKLSEKEINTLLKYLGQIIE